MIYSLVSGFRWFRSCELATINLAEFILFSLDQRFLCGMLLMDLKRAFDLVDHRTLLHKLGMYGCSQQALKWFGSYFSGRFQKTSSKNTISDPLPISLSLSSWVRYFFFCLLMISLFFSLLKMILTLQCLLMISPF